MQNLKTYLPVIGLEVHVELATASKMFCSCPANHFGKKPNTQTCPVCLGLPGTLPVPNKKAIDWCLLIGMALSCQINDMSFFDRKNYFYPDLPKGYQISQHNRPFSVKGWLEVNNKKIRINRVHMEEDTAKLIHQFGNQKCTLIDFNRSGVPLVEIVSEPDLHNAKNAVAYLKKIQQIIRYLEVSDADMEKGSMRLEANVSLQRNNFPQYKVEIKNINSFRFVARAINYEIQRQTEILESSKIPIQETRGFDEKTGKTYPQRTKEEAKDYRYFPEPDIPPFVNLKSKILNLKSLMPELPDEKIARFVKDYQLTKYNAEILAASRKKADYFESMVKKNPSLKASKIANLIVNKKTIAVLKTSVSLEKLDKVIERVIINNPKALSDYKKGKQAVVGYLMGQVMKALKGNADPIIIKKNIESLINA